MQVSPISFKGVYRISDSKFSPVQYKISENIKNVLTSDYYIDQKGLTPADKLKNKGYDIILSPADNDKVDVSVVTDLKKSTDNETYLYNERTYVGTYDNRALFSENDIKGAIKQKTYFGFALLPLAIAFVTLTANSIVKNCQGQIDKVNKIEKVNDSIKDNLKNVQKNTIKFIKK